MNQYLQHASLLVLNRQWMVNEKWEKDISNFELLTCQSHGPVLTACILVFQQAVDGKADRTLLQGELKSAKELTKDNKEAEERMAKEMERLKKVHQEELLQLTKEHQQKVGVFLDFFLLFHTSWSMLVLCSKLNSPMYGVQDWVEPVEFQPVIGQHCRLASVNFKISGWEGRWSAWNSAQSEILLLTFYP